MGCVTDGNVNDRSKDGDIEVVSFRKKIKVLNCEETAKGEEYHLITL